MDSATGQFMVYGKLNYETHKRLKVGYDPLLITVAAHDKDARDTNNATFDLRIVSVTPSPTDLEFYIKQKNEAGTIGFKGCLDYQKAEKYTILVEAKDRGEKIQLSSTCTVTVNIEDGNNHLPVFTGQTGPGRVKETEEHVLVLRLQVTDKDTKGTAAWRAKYKIHGDTNNNFRITTDPETNEGLLYVEKHLDYEVDSLKNLSVSVENEAPYYSCKVRGRPTTGRESGLSTRHVTVSVDDINDPPFFPTAVKAVTVVENVAVGYYLETFTAIDLDRTQANTFVYMQGEDPGDWTTVDAKTGRITTAKILDRESPFVKDSVYKVTIYAVDTGEPRMTGTGTLNIHLIDQNDNVPNLTVSTMDMCLSDEPTSVNITAFDLDKEPNSGPFRFKLQGDIKDKWKVDPDHGYSVNLVKENTVYAGHHELLLEVFDLQDQSAVHSLSITVCNCFDTMMTEPNCRIRKSTGTVGGAGAIGIIFIAILFLLGMLLLAILLSCQREIKPIPDDGSGEYLMKCNTERPGSDCKVVLKSLNQGDGKEISQIKTMMHTLQAPGEELGHYAPHVYAEEGDPGSNTDLDAISTPESHFDPDILLDLDPKFSTLASICRPDATAT
ncbi:cadherin-like protein 26 [Diretmus argenteus]